MAYVENVALFFEFCLNQKTPLEIYNYADKPDLTTQKLVTVINEKLGKSAQKISLPYPLGITAGYAFDTISKVTGKKLPISSIRVKKFCADTVVNADKAHQSEFQAEYDLTHGIKNMLNYEFPVDQKVAA
ncbi:MAG: UDP-N-acetylglucosamine 4-epimerase, partial [Pseudomonadota bacterium]